MRRFVFAMIAVAALGGAGAMMAPASGQTDEEAAPIYGIKIPGGYRDWRLISVNHLAGSTVKQVRAQLGNDIAIKAFREGKLPFPDGSIIAALHWNDVAARKQQGLGPLSRRSPPIFHCRASREHSVHDQGRVEVCRERWLRIRRLHEWQTRQRSVAQNLLPLPRTRKRPRLCLYPLRAVNSDLAQGLHWSDVMTNRASDKDITALVVVDPYNDFISEGGKIWPRIKAVAEANNCVRNMQKILNAARQAKLRVFYAIHHRYRPGDYETMKYVAPIQRAAWRAKSFEFAPGAASFEPNSSRPQVRPSRRNTGAPAASRTPTLICCLRSTVFIGSSLLA